MYICVYLANLLQPPTFSTCFPSSPLRLGTSPRRCPQRTGDEGRLPGKELALQHQQGQPRRGRSI